MWVLQREDAVGKGTIARAYVIHPGESYRQVIKLDGLQAGEYRLRKEIHHTDSDEVRAYYVGFTITG